MQTTYTFFLCFCCFFLLVPSIKTYVFFSIRYPAHDLAFNLKAEAMNFLDPDWFLSKKTTFLIDLVFFALFLLWLFSDGVCVSLKNLLMFMICVRVCFGGCFILVILFRFSIYFYYTGLKYVFENNCNEA